MPEAKIKKSVRGYIFVCTQNTESECFERSIFGSAKALGIAPHYEILLVISLGKPKEKVVLEPIGLDGDFVKYWRVIASRYIMCPSAA